MTAKRGATSLAGILLIDKPASMTSHDVVSRVRRATGERRVGHAGTLDPDATGLLVVLVGPYTRLEPWLSSAVKRYEAGIVFGTETDTDDAAGTVTRTAAVPAEVANAQYAGEVLAGFVGESMQAPPQYSAIKVGGRTAHRVARGGGEIDLPPRAIEVHSATLTCVTTDAELRWDVEFVVSKGTYIRSLARDTGRAMGTAAHLGALRRTGSGPAVIDDAVSLDDVEDAAARGHVTTLFADPITLTGLPVIEADPSAVMAGRPLEAPGDSHPRYAVAHDGVLLAIYALKNDKLLAEAVFPVLPKEDA